MNLTGVGTLQNNYIIYKILDNLINKFQDQIGKPLSTRVSDNWKPTIDREMVNLGRKKEK